MRNDDEPRKAKVANCARCDRIEAHSIGNEELLARRREQLAKARERIAELEARIAELGADKPEPGPWLTGDELKAVIPTLKAGDVVEVSCRGHKASGELYQVDDSLLLWSDTVRHRNGNRGHFVDALRIIERAPEPGADIPDEVVEAVLFSIESSTCARLAEEPAEAMRIVRAALAAADAKQTELEGGVA